ncbi:MAG: ABC transporter substrate-binding protein [Dehalococcoidia bacterium]|nr:ABC transporter substrate-binding protein [Dehalococcoidia bacterium]
MTSEYWDKYWRRATSRRRFLGTGATLGAGAAGLALVGCGGDDDDGSGNGGDGEPTSAPSNGNGDGPRTGGTARYPLEGMSTGDPPTLFPFENLTYTAQHPATLHYSRLLTEVAGPDISPDDYTSLEGDICEGLPEQPDDRTYIFTFRSNVMFHDKEPMNGRQATAEDFVQTYDAFLALSQNAGVYEDVIEGMDATDEQTLRITLREPFAPFLTIHASTPEGVWFIPVETINNNQVQEDPVGTGPWVFQEYEPGVAMRWGRHENFHLEGQPYIPNVEAALFNDPQRIIAALESGDFDWSTLSGSVYQNASQTLDPNGTEAFTGNGSFGAFYFNFDNDDGIWRDTRMRQALSMAMNRSAGLDTLDQTGQGDWFSPMCATNLAPFYLSPQSEDFGENARFFEYNPEESRRLIQEVTGQDSINVRVTGNIDRYGAAMQQAMEFWAAQMSEGGFNIELNYQEYGSYIQSTYLGDIPEGIGIGPLIGSPRDPNDILSRNLASSSARHTWGGTPIEEMGRIDEMIAEQRSILDPDERVQYIHDMQREMAEYLLVVPYTASAGYSYANPWVENMHWKNSYSVHLSTYAQAYFTQERIDRG